MTDKKDQQLNYRIPYELKESFFSAVPERERAATVRKLISEEIIRRKNGESPADSRNNIIDETGLSSFVSDLRHKDFTESITKSSTFYIFTNEAEIFLNLYGHLRAISRRITSNTKTRTLFINGDIRETPFIIRNIPEYRKVSQCIPKLFKTLTIISDEYLYSVTPTLSDSPFSSPSNIFSGYEYRSCTGAHSRYTEAKEIFDTVFECIP